MALVGTIVVALALLLGALNGLRRGAVKEGLALIGVLFGTLLVLLWSERWGIAVARRTGWQPSTGQWIAAMGLLWGTALLAGYGSASLLRWSPTRLATSQRVSGALLGLLNGALLVGFSLRFTQLYLYGETAQTQQTTWIRAAVASRFVLERLDLILLGLAWLVAVVSLVVTLTNLVRRLMAAPRAVPAAGAKPAPSKPASDKPVTIGGTTQQTPVAPGMERSFLEKPGGPGASRTT